MINRVFVYGTLMTGEENHYLIADYATRITPARIKGVLYDLPYGYPAVLPGDDWVWGELVELINTPRALAVLDELEDYRGPGQDNLYEREIIEVHTIDDKRCLAWVYRWAPALPPGAKRVSTGRWRKH